MSSIFDFNNLHKLISRTNPSVIIVVDTNVVMNCADFFQWQSDIANPIYVLTYPSIYEFSKIKLKNDQSSKDKAIKAIRALVSLSDRGHSASGIQIENVGWFISMPFPTKDALDPELAKYEAIRDINHDTDTKLMILHQELQRAFPKIPVVSLSGDNLYIFFGRDLGLYVYAFTSFPLAIQDWLSAKVPKLEIDPDKVLSEALQRLEEKATVVELTLTGKNLDRAWRLDSKRYGAIIAEGEGILYDSVLGKIGFLWRLPYRPLTSVNVAKDPIYGDADLYEEGASNSGPVVIPILNFLGREQEISFALRIILMNNLGYLATQFPYEDLPTLQSPICWLEDWMRRDLGVSRLKDADEYKDLPDSERDVEEILRNMMDKMAQTENDPDAFKSFDELMEYCIKYLYDRPNDWDEIKAFVAISLCTWNVGHTIRLTLPPEDILAVEKIVNKDT